MNSKIKYSLNSLTEEEVKILLESLLHCSCINVFSNWYDDHTTKMQELAIKIRTLFPQIICENTFIFNDDLLKDETNELLLNYFPELKVDMELNATEFSVDHKKKFDLIN
jgi:hypothetical protein